MIPGMEPQEDFGGDAIVLMSGGPDSLAMEEIANRRHENVYNVFGNFHQEANENELECAKEITEYYDADLWEVDIGTEVLGLHEQGEDVEEYGAEERLSDPDLDYIPMRYVHLLAHAGSIADMTGAEYIYWGIHYEGGLVPDHDAEIGIHMTSAFEASTWTDQDYNIVCPFIGHTRPNVLSQVDDWGVPWEITYSCFRDTDDGNHCGDCHSCHSRVQKFSEAGIDDPTQYKESGQ